MTDKFETILYVVDGAVATITMNRPDMANAQDSTLIDELDAAFDLADADDAVRVVILAGAGKHFSSGHDLKALVSGDGSDPWVAMRETPEGKFHHEQVMYVERCRRIHDFRKPTIAAVQGKCVAAGLMLDHVGLVGHAKQLRKAIDQVLNEDKTRTGDLGGKASTSDFAKALVQRVSSVA